MFRPTVRKAFASTSSAAICASFLCQTGCSHIGTLPYLAVTGGTQSISFEGTNESDLCWNGDGSKVAFMRTESLKGNRFNSEVEVLDVRSMDVIFRSGGSFDVGPTWAPDGSFLVYNHSADHSLSVVK